MDHHNLAKAAFAKVAPAHDCMPHTLALVQCEKGIDAFMDLHAIVTANTEFVKPRSRASIVGHVRNGHFALGIHAHDTQEMIAQALLTFPDQPGATNINGYPLHGHLSPEKSAIIQTVGIHPAHRKCGLPAMLFNAAAQLAEGYGRTHVIAKSRLKNTSARQAFARAGYEQLGLPGVVAGDSYFSVFMVQPLNALKVKP